MKPLLLIGGGGHCHAVIDVIEAAGTHSIAGIVRPPNEAHTNVMGYPTIGTDDDLPTLLVETPCALVTVGQVKSPGIRIRLFEWLTSHGAERPVIKSPTAYLSPHATIRVGSMVMHSSLINANARIGMNVIINSHALIEHDVVVGDHCHVSTGARVNGDVRIGSGCFIGSGAVLKEGIEIGEGTVIGAGLTVLRDVPAGTLLRSNHG